MNLVHENESHEAFIVKDPNAIVKPLAMMIKVSHTSVTLSTVFTSLVHMSITNLTMKVEFCVDYCYPISKNQTQDL